MNNILIKTVQDLDDVRDYIENGMMIAAKTRINLIKRDLLKESKKENKIRGKLTVIRRKGNHC